MIEEIPFFSVVIPLYNKQNYIEETLESVFNQTFENFEIIIVNDGSTDNSAKVLESIEDKRIRVINQENAGVSVARNNGIKEAKTEYICFLDADDLWQPEFLEIIYKLIDDYKDLGLYSTSYQLINEVKNYRDINLQGIPNENYRGILPNYFESVALGDNIVWTSATCIPKKVFEDNNIWFPPGEKYGEDQYVWARVAMKYDIAFDSKVCAYYNIGSENNTESGISKEKEPHKCILNLRKFKKDIKDQAKVQYFDKYIERHIVSIIMLNISKGEKKLALKQVKKFKLSSKNIIKCTFLIILPSPVYKILKILKNKKGLMSNKIYLFSRIRDKVYNSFFYKLFFKLDKSHISIGNNYNFVELPSIKSDGSGYFLKIGNNFSGRNNLSFCFNNNSIITIGDNVFFNNGCSFTALESIDIGDDVLFGENVKIYDHNHEYKDFLKPIHEQGFNSEKVTIGSNVWIGSNVTILKGVSIGKNSIIGANTLIYKSVPENSVVKLEQKLSITSIK